MADNMGTLSVYTLADLRRLLNAQLPEGLRGKYLIEVSADAYMLRAMAMFIKDGKSYSTELEGLPDEPKLPDAFLSWIILQSDVNTPARTR